MKKLKLSRVAVIIILSLIIITQFCVRIFAGAQKEYYHMDEMYSYGLMNYKQVSIVDDENLMGEWHSPEYFRDYISISSEESGDWSPVYTNQVNDVHPPLFYLLLRIFASMTIDGFSKWTGIILNMIIWIGSAILVFFITRRMTRDDRLALIVTFFAGLTAAALNTTIYIRMYELAALNILIITHVALWLLDKKKIEWKHSAIIIPALVTGILTHYHYLFFVAILAVMVIYKLYKSNRKPDILKFVVSGVAGGGIALAIFPAMIPHLLRGHPESSGIGSFFDHLKGYLIVANRNIFANLGLFIIGILLIALIITIIRKKKITTSKNLLLLLLPTVVFFLVIVVTAPWIELRYIMPICPIIAIVALVAISDFIKNLFSKWHVIATAVVVIAVMIATPFVHPKLEMAYEGYDHIVDRVVEINAPILYVFNTDHNRLLDDMFLLTFVDSYVIDSRDVNESNLAQVFADRCVINGLTVIINSENDNDAILEQIESATGLSETKWIQRLNAADVYHLYYDYES